MQSRIIVDSREESLLSTHKVLRNTYFLLALTLAFSAVVAYVSMAMNLPRPGLIIMLVGVLVAPVILLFFQLPEDGNWKVLLPVSVPAVLAA